MTSRDTRQKAILKEMEEFLKRFEPQGSLHGFKNTAIYRSSKLSYEVYLEKVTKQQHSKEKTIELPLQDRTSEKDAKARLKCRDSAISQ